MKDVVFWMMKVLYTLNASCRHPIKFFDEFWSNVIDNHWSPAQKTGSCTAVKLLFSPQNDLWIHAAITSSFFVYMNYKFSSLLIKSKIELRGRKEINLVIYPIWTYLLSIPILWCNKENCWSNAMNMSNCI